MCVTAKSSGTVTGVAYWFTLGLYSGVTMTTGPAAYEGVCIPAMFLILLCRPVKYPNRAGCNLIETI